MSSTTPNFMLVDSGPEDRYRIVVTHSYGQTTYGWFASEQEAEVFGHQNRDRLGINRCISWNVEHRDA